MNRHQLTLNIRRWLQSRDDWPGALSDSERDYVIDAISQAAGFDMGLGPCPVACRPYLRAMVHKVLVPLALPVTLELELACADQDP